MSGGQDVEIPSAEVLATMSREDLARLGARLDGVELVEYGEQYEPGSKADKRAERKVARWFLLSAISAIAFVVVFIAWPWQYETAYSDDQLAYALYNPLIGLLLGLCIFSFGIGIIALAKKIAPHELAIQQRHVGMSAEVDRVTMGAELIDVVDKMQIKRRGVLKGSLALAGGTLGIAALVPVLGGFIKNPWENGDKSELWVTPWATPADGTLVRMAYIDGTLVRPEDITSGSITTVFPAVEGGAKASDAAVMLFRLRPNEQVQFRDETHKAMRYGDLYAYSKICTHVGCPVSLYEQQTNRVLCPCHQSQFDITDGAKPVFGPASRPLPQLPLGVDADGYLVALSDFIEPVGPGFWENKGSY